MQLPLLPLLLICSLVHSMWPSSRQHGPIKPTFSRVNPYNRLPRMQPLELNRFSVVKPTFVDLIVAEEPEDSVGRRRSTTCPEPRRLAGMWAEKESIEHDYLIDDEGHPISPRTLAAVSVHQAETSGRLKPVEAKTVSQSKQGRNTIEIMRTQLEQKQARALDEVRAKHEKELQALSHQNSQALLEKDKEIKDLMDHMNMLKAELDHAHEQEMQRDLNHAWEMQESNRRILELEAENCQLKNNVVEKDDLIDQANKKIMEMKDAMLQNEERVESELEDLKERNQQLQKSLEATVDTISELEAKKQALSTTVAEAQHTIHDLGRELYQTQIVAENLRARLLKATSHEYMRKWEAKMRRRAQASSAGKSPKEVVEGESRIRRSSSMNDMGRVRRERKRSEQDKRVTEARRMAMQQSPPIVGDDDFWMNWMNLWFNARAKL